MSSRKHRYPLKRTGDCHDLLEKVGSLRLEKDPPSLYQSDFLRELCDVKPRIRINPKVSRRYSCATVGGTILLNGSEGATIWRVPLTESTDTT